MDARLLCWMSEVRRYNRTLHLMGSQMLTDLEADVTACCEVVCHIHEPVIADLGSGSGLPAIPLGIMHPQTHVYLIERSDKKCQFLKHVLDMLALDNLELIQADPLVRPIEPFAAVIARAFSPRNQLVSVLGKILVPGGRFYDLGTRAGAALPGKAFTHQETYASRCPGTALSLVKYVFSPQ